MKKLFILILVFTLSQTDCAYTQLEAYKTGPDLIFTGENVLNYFGASATSAGDVNADGYNDFIIGAPDFNSKQGRSYLYFGGYHPDNIPDVIFTGEASWYPFFGHSSAGAGDVNHDGYDDIIIGAYGWAGVNGRAYIFLGGSNMDNIPDLVIEGEQLFNDLGMCVASAGDINEDGYDDVIVNARGYNNWTGRAYVFFGGSNMDNTPDLIFTGENIDDQFSSTVANAGDVNGDHRPDLIITAYRYNNSTGKAYVYYGGAGMDNTADVIMTGENTDDQFGSSAATAGDLNGDGYSDIIIQASEFNNSTGRAYIYYGSSAMDNIPDIILNGEAPGNNFGAVTFNQDIDGDGYSDIEIGAQGFDGNKGKAYIYLGSMNMDTVPDFIMNGENSNDLFGIRASSTGDINSDGYNDFLISAFGYNNSTGKVYLFLGTGEPLSDCIIAGPQLVTTGEVSVLYRSTGPPGYWELSNYDNTQADIVSAKNLDSVLVDAGNIPGHFVLYYLDRNSHVCTKHVYVDNPTPVEISVFNSFVSERDVTLKWTTNSELNNSGFEIEMSNVKGQTSNEWNKIGYVPGNGTSTYIHNYEFIVKNLNSGKYNYRLKQIDFNGNFEYFELANDVIIGIPAKYYLSQNYPNPFNPVTNLEFGIPDLGFVTLKIYDVIGRELIILVNENKEPGYYKIKFNAGNLSSGVYFYRMTAGDFVAVKKFVVLK